MNLANRTQLLGLLAVAAVALLAGDRLLLTPLTQSWKARSERISALKRSVTQGALLLDREPSIRARWDVMRTNTLLSEVSAAESQLFKAFDRWSRESRIGVTSIRPQWKRQSEDSATLECRVDAFGSLAAVTRFLFDVEKDPLGLKVDVVELATRDERGDQLTLGLQVSGLQLRQPPKP